MNQERTPEQQQVVDKAAEEVWMPVVGHEDRYMISNTGRVKSLYYYNPGKRTLTPRELVLTPVRSSQGYLTIKIAGKTVFVHRLVGFAFIPNPENKPHINHINGVRDDNRVENLEWCTHQENMTHSVKVLKTKRPGAKYFGEDQKTSKLTEKDVLWFHQYLKDGGLVREFAKEKQVAVTTLRQLARGESWKHLKLDWKSVYKKYPHKLTEGEWRGLMSGWGAGKKKILQYAKSGELIKEWESLQQAADALNIDASNITNCAKQKLKSVGGFVWKYKP